MWSDRITIGDRPSANSQQSTVNRQPSTVNKTAIALSSRVINYPSDSESPLEVDYEVT